MERAKVSIQGIDTQSKEVYTARDGSCLGIDKLRPVGNVGNHRWKPIMDVESEFTASIFNINHVSLRQDYAVSDLKGVFVHPDRTSIFSVTDGATSYLREEYLTNGDLYDSPDPKTDLDISSLVVDPIDVKFNPDGTKVFFADADDDTIHECALSTAWDISTINLTPTNSYTHGSTLVSFDISADGTILYILSTVTITSYDLTGAWVMSTAGATGNSYAISSGVDTDPKCFRLSNDGYHIFVVGNSADAVHRFELSTAWNESTATFKQSLDVSNEDATPFGIDVAVNGDLFVTGEANENIYQYKVLNINNVYYEFDRWYFLLTGNTHLKLISSQNTGESNESETVLLEYDLNDKLGVVNDTTVITESSFAVVSNKLYLCLYSASYNFNLMFRIYEDTIYPNVIKPKFTVYKATVNSTTSNDKGEFDALFPADRKKVALGRGPANKRRVSASELAGVSFGEAPMLNYRAPLESFVASNPPNKVIEGGIYPGILKNKDKFFAVIYAWKLPSGEWVKHSEPEIVEITEQAGDAETYTDYSTLTFSPVGSYTDNTTNYDANTTEYDDYQFNYDGSFDEFALEMGIFMTVAKDTYEEALIEGTFFKIGDISNPGEDDFNWSDNEELISAGEVLNIDPYSHHIITCKRINEYKNSLSAIQKITNFSLPAWNWNYANTNKVRINDTGGTFDWDDSVVQVKIETEFGTYYRLNYIKLQGAGSGEVDFASYYSYPDQRATELKFYANDSGYYLIETLTLQPHPFLNLAYNYTSSPNTSVVITSGVSETPDFTQNNSMLVETKKIQFSDITQLIFPLEWTLELNDVIQNIVDNADSPGEERFGDYPIYFLCEHSILAGREGSGVLIAKMDLLVNGVGVRTPNGFETYRNTLYFVSDQGIHALRGVEVVDIYDTIEDFALQTINSNNSITETSSYSSFLSATDLFIASSQATKEILFGTNGGNALLIYNEKHQMWYTYSIITDDAIANDLSRIVRTSQGTFYFKDTELLKWGGTEASTGSFSFVLNPLIMDDYSVMKSIRTGLLEGYFDLGSGAELKVVLQGKRTTHDDWITLISYTEDTTKTFNSFYLKSNYGSMQAYRLLVNGDSLNTGTYIGHLLMSYVVKNRKFKK